MFPKTKNSSTYLDPLRGELAGKKSFKPQKLTQVRKSGKQCSVISSQQKSVKPSRYAKIPGSVFKWIEQNGGKEIKTMIKQCKQTPNL